MGALRIQQLRGIVDTWPADWRNVLAERVAVSWLEWCQEHAAGNDAVIAASFTLDDGSDPETAAAFQRVSNRAFWETISMAAADRVTLPSQLTRRG